ncbi:hypothetical protein QBC38DRAFT_371296, partial [Podospora fimiseda]
IEGLEQGVKDAYLALIMVSAPNLRHLRFGGHFFLDSMHIGNIMRFAISSKPLPTILPHLETVCLERKIPRQREWSERNTEDILPFFYLPKLKNMSIWISDPPTRHIPWPLGTPPCLPNLETLKIHDLREVHLEQTLSITPNLKSLHWEWHYEPGIQDDEFNTHVMDLSLFKPALQPVQQSLVELRIEAHVGVWQWWFPVHRVVNSPPTWLARFPKLKKLRIPVICFTGFDGIHVSHMSGDLVTGECLPHTLEQLDLSDDLLPGASGQILSLPRPK